MLAALDGDLLATHACWFGGGTALALRFGEYRESVDIDFLVSELAGYRSIRHLVAGAADLAAITTDPRAFTLAREARADQYGVRVLLQVEGVPIKLEFVHESRVSLERPGAEDTVCGVATLVRLDMITTKLLANSDRWSDDGAFSRDLVDLAMLAPSPAELRLALDKAAGAYGPSVETDLAKAIRRLQEREGRLERCMAAMAMTLPVADVRTRITTLLPS